MSISLNNHESRITALENRYWKMENSQTFNPVVIAANGAFTFQLGKVFDWKVYPSCSIRLSIWEPGSHLENTWFDFWCSTEQLLTHGCYFNDTYGNSRYIPHESAYIKLEQDMQRITVYAKYGYEHSGSLNGQSITVSNFMFAKVILYNFSYIIIHLIFTPLSYLFNKEVQEVKMSISLNDHESRIKALENGESVEFQTSGNKGYWKYGRILINWITQVGDGTQYWLKSFSGDTTYSVVVAGFESGASENSGFNYGSQKTGSIEIYSWQSGRKKNLIAIGYLISDRILKYIIYAVDFLASLINWRCKISMAISLKALYDQVQAIKTSQSTWTTGSGTNGRWWKESSTGLIIQAGEHYHPENPTNSMLTFPISFSTDKSYGINTTSMDGYATWTTTPTTSSVQVDTDGVRNSYVRWVAIGYLISNRLLKYIREVV